MALAADDEAALNWIMPTPKPPTAPARSPSNTSTGTLSSSDFFRNFAILCSPVGICCPCDFSICASNPCPGQLRKTLWR